MFLRKSVQLKVIILLVAAGLLLSACSGARKKTSISIATAGTGGSFYPIGVALADLINRDLPGVKAVAEETGGAIANMKLIQGREVEIAFVSGEAAAPAFLGQPPWKEKIQAKVLWRMFTNAYNLVALKGSGIKTISDLKGKKVSLGPPGSAANATGLEVLKVHGLKESDFKPIYLGPQEAADALADRQVDAAFLLSATPSAAIRSLETRNEVTLVAADQKILEEYTRNIPSAFPLKIPAKTYKGQDEDIWVLGNAAYAIGLPDLDQDLVYKIMKLAFSNLDYLAKAHPLSRDFSLADEKEVQKMGTSIHPGALKYAQEVAKSKQGSK